MLGLGQCSTVEMCHALFLHDTDHHNHRGCCVLLAQPVSAPLASGMDETLHLRTLPGMARLTSGAKGGMGYQPFPPRTRRARG